MPSLSTSKAVQDKKNLWMMKLKIIRYSVNEAKKVFDVTCVSNVANTSYQCRNHKKLSSFAKAHSSPTSLGKLFWRESTMIKKGLGEID